MGIIAALINKSKDEFIPVLIAIRFEYNRDFYHKECGILSQLIAH